MAAVERGSFKAGPASRCAGCPFAGLCTPCKPLAVRGEFGSGEVLVFKNIKELLSLPKLPDIIDFSSARQRSGEPLIIGTSEKTCSECKEPASTCGHSKSKTSAVAAA